MKKRITVDSITLDIEVMETPLFRFVCPKCQSVLFEGAVFTDMEDEFECICCGFKDELWFFPHTIIGSNLWTIGAHYTNDPLTNLDLDKVVKYFLWTKFKSLPIHGGEPYHWGSFEQCCEKILSGRKVKKGSAQEEPDRGLERL